MVIQIQHQKPFLWLCSKCAFKRLINSAKAKFKFAGILLNLSKFFKALAEFFLHFIDMFLRDDERGQKA